MGDVGDVFRAVKEQNKERKANNLKVAQEAATLNWLKHTPYHWSVMLDGDKLDYWPSTNKWMWRGKKFNGTIQDVEGFVANRGGVVEQPVSTTEQPSDPVVDTPPPFDLPVFRDVITVDESDEDIPF